MAVSALDARLAEQNTQAAVWLDCESRGLKHQLEPVREVRSVYRPVDDGRYTTSRRCRRCPVRIMSVPR